MLTISQLSDILFVLLTFQLLYKQVLFELENEASFIRRFHRITVESNLMIMVIGTLLMLVFPHTPYPKSLLGSLTAQAIDVLSVIALPQCLLVEISDFYEKYTLTRPKLRWVILSQFVLIVLTFLLILR